MKTNKSTSAIIHCAVLFLLVATSIMDVLISESRIAPLIVVEDDFVSSVFSGVLTFSTLGLSVLAIIISVLDTRNYGLRLRDILSFKTLPVNFVGYIVDSTVLTIVALVALILEWCNLIVVVTIVTILYTNITSILVFKIVTNSAFCEKIVYEELEKGKIPSNFVFNWIEEYKKAIINNCESDIYAYAKILKKCMDGDNSSIVENSLRDLFEVACQKRLVGDAITLVFVPLEMQSYIVPVCANCINELRYASADEIARMDLPGAIKSIMLAKRVWEGEKQELVYLYFESVILGNMPSEQKHTVFGQMLEIVTSLTNDISGCVQEQVICWIFAKLLVMEDQETSKQLYEKLMKSLYLNNLHNKSPKMISVVARMVMGAYFYSEVTANILAGCYFEEKKRQKIRELVQRPIMLDFLTDVSLNTWIIPFREQLFRFYMDGILDCTVDCTPYYSYNTDMKEDIIKQAQILLLWNRNSKARFALWYYFACCSDRKCKLLCECLKKLRSMSTYDSSIRDAMLSQYKDNGAALTNDCLEQIKTLGCYYEQTPFFCTSDFVKKTYELVNSLPLQYSYDISVLVP